MPGLFMCNYLQASTHLDHLLNPSSHAPPLLLTTELTLQPRLIALAFDRESSRGMRWTRQ